MQENRELNIENRITAVEVKLEEVISNHLPHLQEAIDKVDTRTWAILFTLIMGFLISIGLSLWK